MNWRVWQNKTKYIILISRHNKKSNQQFTTSNLRISTKPQNEDMYPIQSSKQTENFQYNFHLKQS